MKTLTEIYLAFWIPNTALVSVKLQKDILNPPVLKQYILHTPFNTTLIYHIDYKKNSLNLLVVVM